MIRNYLCRFCGSRDGSLVGVSLRTYDSLEVLPAALSFTLISEKRMGRMVWTIASIFAWRYRFWS